MLLIRLKSLALHNHNIINYICYKNRNVKFACTIARLYSDTKSKSLSSILDVENVKNINNNEMNINQLNKNDIINTENNNLTDITINDNTIHKHINDDDSIESSNTDTISNQYLSLTDPLKSQNSGVFRESEVDDIRVLVYNFTAPALAEALRDRETQLQSAATFFFNNDMVSLKDILTPFLKSNVEKRRIRRHALNLEHGFTRKEIVILQRYLHRIPRQIFHGIYVYSYSLIYMYIVS